MPAVPRNRRAPRPWPSPARLALARVALAALLLAGGCNYHYSQGRALEAQERWEEAAIEYRLAYVDDPEDPDFVAALERANKVVARENVERYRDYLAKKQFAKAYARLLDAARQDPAYEPAGEELKKWMRVLVSGQVKFAFETLQSNVSLADEIRLVARINTPNPGQTIDAEIDIDTGIFFVEDLLYEPPDTLLAYYTLNAIGVSLVRGKTEQKQFTNTEFLRFINFRSPVLDRVEGRLNATANADLKEVMGHRATLGEGSYPADSWAPVVNPHYSLTIRGDRIVVDAADQHGEFTPRFLYVNRSDRRMLVDFGRYEVRQDPRSRRWGLVRLSLADADYFARLSLNVALQPYFFYHGDAYQYVQPPQG